MAKNADAYRITVLTGLNAGYETGLPKSKISIGGMPDDTIQLDGLDEHIAQFSSHQGRLKVRPSVEGVVVNGGETCPKDRTAEFSLPARIQLTEDTSIFFEGVGAHRARLSAVGKTGMFSAAFATALLLSPIGVNVEYANVATATSLRGDDAPDAEDPLIRTKAQNSASTERTGTAFAAITCENCADDAAKFLDTAFARRELAGLEAEANDGTVRVSGKIATEHRSVWDAVRMSFDQKFAGSVPLLASITTIVDGDAPFAVATVWLGDTKEVTTIDGTTHFIGDKVQDNWTISGIEDTFVELERDNKILRIRF